ncbi:hypothetical protein GXM_01124 [Nostoc sphaeroides CCNUC1]|uniref:Uncharacterized protein n=1 Tax=Nostoc sphaeroides CCNUC1 TaxID=2653204 RepID=A0A5P8VTK3_9NOSO|nr:hypothetical protein GXM_01124 [Nostoc sphaeroides CCNUC1]
MTGLVRSLPQKIRNVILSGTQGRENFHQMFRSAQDNNLSIYARLR